MGHDLLSFVTLISLLVLGAGGQVLWVIVSSQLLSLEYNDICCLSGCLMDLLALCHNLSFLILLDGLLPNKKNHL